MHFPETWTERLPVLEVLEDDWESVPRAVLVIASLFYAIFLYQLARGTGFLLMIDLVLIPIHEGGHLLFRFFGEFLNIAGGTLMQLAVPFMLATYFAFQRQVQGTAFCTFIFFEQFLPISTYMADARAQELPLLTVGDADYVIHDWNYLFTRLGVIDHDTQIAYVFRILGWIGMISTFGWMVWRSLRPQVSMAFMPSNSEVTAPLRPMKDEKIEVNQ